MKQFIQTYTQLFEGLAGTDLTKAQARITARLQRELKIGDATTNDYRTADWIKKEIGLDLSVFLTQIRNFIINASIAQIPNVLAGVKAVDFAKYINTEINRQTTEYIKNAFHGVAASKKILLKTRYVFGGSKSLANDIYSKIKDPNSNLDAGVRPIIDMFITIGPYLSIIISHGLRIDVNGHDIALIQPYVQNIIKWENDYLSYFNTLAKDTRLMAYITSATAGIWA